MAYYDDNNTDPRDQNPMLPSRPRVPSAQPWPNWGAQEPLAPGPSMAGPVQAPELSSASPAFPILGTGQPTNPLDTLRGNYESAVKGEQDILSRGPASPSIWRRLGGLVLGTGAGIGGHHGYGRYGYEAGNPELAAQVAKGFTFGGVNADYDRRLKAAQAGVTGAQREYEMGREENAQDIQQRNIQSEIEARNKPQIITDDQGNVYRVPQDGGPAERIPIAPFPDQLGQNTQLPQALTGTNAATRQTKQEQFSQDQQARLFQQQQDQQQRQFAEQEKLANMRQKGTAATERSYQFHTKEFDNIGKPIADRSDRIQRLLISLNSNSPQADSLLAPELLTSMAGGQGSGLRMNEAEIARIVGGRSNWTALQAAVNKWKKPEDALSIPADQKKQMFALVNAMRDRVQGKQALLTQAQQRLADADDPAVHKQLLAEVKRRMAAIDNIEDAVGKNAQGQILYRSQGKFILADGTEVPTNAPTTTTKK